MEQTYFLNIWIKENDNYDFKVVCDSKILNSTKIITKKNLEILEEK